MYGVSPQAYDRAITVFSPDGRLFQVEYAKEAVKRGSTAVGLVGKEGVVLVAHKPTFSKRVISSSMKKIFDIDKHILITASGLVADARRLVDTARVNAQKHTLTYEEPMDIYTQAKEIADLMQAYTQYGGVRPFGVSLMVAGVDNGSPKLYEVEPSGSLTGYLCDSIGSAKKAVDAYLEKKYDKTKTNEELEKLAIDALKHAGVKELGVENLEIAEVRTDSKISKFLSEKEIGKLLE